MRNQFLRLYVLMIAIVLLLLYSFNAIYNEVTKKDRKYYASIEHIFDLKTTHQSYASFKEHPMNSLVLPERLQTRLNRGEVIPLELQNGHWVYYKKQDNKLYSYGPLPPDTQEEDLNNYFIIMFYSALALFFLVLIKPLFSELAALLNEAQAFGKKPSKMDIPARTSSTIYPLIDAFNKMSRQIVDLLTMNRDLSRTIAHEIRTPLSRMKFVTQLLKDDIESKHSSRLEQDIEEIDQLVSDYLSFAKLESSDNLFNKKTRNIAPFMVKLENKFAVYEAEFDISFSYQDAKCSYDAKHLSLAIQNLISNALRYAQEKVVVVSEYDEKYCQITVSDDGPGLSDDKLEIFDAFVRKKNNKQDKGFGLGLYIARRVAILHSGDLTVTNDAQLGGAKFTLRWPRAITKK